MRSSVKAPTIGYSFPKAQGSLCSPVNKSIKPVIIKPVLAQKLKTAMSSATIGLTSSHTLNTARDKRTKPYALFEPEKDLKQLVKDDCQVNGVQSQFLNVRQSEPDLFRAKQDNVSNDRCQSTDSTIFFDLTANYTTMALDDTQRKIRQKQDELVKTSKMSYGQTLGSYSRETLSFQAKKRTPS